MAAPYVPRSKDAKQKLRGVSMAPVAGTVTLACGHETSAPPVTSNPERWWCCGAFQKKTRGRPLRGRTLGNSKKAHGGAGAA